MKKLIVALSLISVLFSCSKEDQSATQDATEKEFSNVRLLVTDEESPTINYINPSNNEVNTYETAFAKSYVYANNNGRFGVIINNTNHSLKVLDCGIESHGDHAHIEGNVRMLNVGGTFNKPIHFYANAGDIAVFNDGTGKVSYTSEEELSGNSIAVFNEINNPDATPHHGAMVIFNNGNYGITIDDNNIANASPSLPERVKIYDKNGSLLHDSTVATRGIHGEASDGYVSLFGSYSGILKVIANGEQTIIPYPNNFAATDILGAIYFLYTANKFYGRSSAKGIFEINPNTGAINSVLETNQLTDLASDQNGTILVALTNDGKLRVYEASNNTIKIEKNVLPEWIAGNPKSTIKTTKKFIYATIPTTGEVWQISTTNLSIVKKIKVGDKPFKIAILGGESN